MAALTQTRLYNRIRSELGDTPYYDTCTEAMDATEVGLDVADGTKYSHGNIVEFQDDGELCYVTSVSSNTLTVIRNFNFSVTTTAGTGTTHSINAQIAVDPTFKFVDITRALQGIVANLWPHVWRTPTTTDTDGPVVSITAVNGTRWYSLGSTYLNVFDIGLIQQVVSTSPKKIVTYGDRDGYGPVSLRHGLATGISSQFVGLYFPAINNYDNAILVNVISPIDLTQTVGGTYDYLDDNTPAEDCLMYLTVARLIETKEIQRLTQEDVHQSATGVMAGQRTRGALIMERQGLHARYRWAMMCEAVWPRLPKSKNFQRDTDAGGRY